MAVPQHGNSLSPAKATVTVLFAQLLLVWLIVGFLSVRSSFGRVYHAGKLIEDLRDSGIYA